MAPLVSSRLADILRGPRALIAFPEKARRSLVRPFQDFLFPPVCFVCGGLLGALDDRVCTSCLKTLHPVSPDDARFQETLVRTTADGELSGLIAAYYFESDGPLQSMIHQLKYQGMTSLGVLLGVQLGRRVETTMRGEVIAGMIPVPLHRSKRRERGYNQSEFICRGMASVLRAPVRTDLLMRIHYTQTQTKLNREERRLNVEGAFTLRPGHEAEVKDGCFLLVDDVLTTGATMQSSARALLDGGAKKVIGCAVGMAV